MPETAHKAVAEMKSFSAQHEFWKAGYLAMAEDDPALATKMAFETITATGIRKTNHAITHCGMGKNRSPGSHAIRNEWADSHAKYVQHRF